jgi:hypothetical protein
MKKLNWLGWLFLFIGLALLGGAVFLYQDTQAFIDRALTARGTVIDLARSASSSRTGSGTGSSSTWRPVVTFTDHEGRSVEFISSVGSNPPSHRKGDVVEVLYLPDDSQQARIKGFIDLWLFPLILLGIGSIFFLFGLGFTVPGFIRTRARRRLRQSGTRILADVLGVESTRRSYRINAQWQNPRTSRIHVFSSDEIGFDPTNYVGTKQVNVFIDPNNPRKYLVDLSFLPRLAD